MFEINVSESSPHYVANLIAYASVPHQEYLKHAKNFTGRYAIYKCNRFTDVRQAFDETISLPYSPNR